MVVLIAVWCAAHAPAEVEYVCSSFAWSAFWFVLGWVTTVVTIILAGGRK